MESNYTPEQKYAGEMEMNSPPQCICGRGFMLLHKAGELSTRPGSYYYICPASLNHPKKFYWYDDYQRDISAARKGKFTTGGVDSGTFKSETYVHKKDMVGKRPTSGASSMHHSCASNNEFPSSDDEMARTDNNIKRNTRNPSLKRTISQEEFCCCFGCICLMLCLFLLLILFIVIAR